MTLPRQRILHAGRASASCRTPASVVPCGLDGTVSFSRVSALHLASCNSPASVRLVSVINESVANFGCTAKRGQGVVRDEAIVHHIQSGQILKRFEGLQAGIECLEVSSTCMMKV